MKTLTLTLDVAYELNGETLDRLSWLLSNAIERAVGEGLLTGDTAATVDDWRYKITRKQYWLD